MTPWARASLALRLLALDPALGGIAVRARVGPARSHLSTQLNRVLPFPVLRLSPTLGADELDGGIDVTASLGSGTMVQRRGILDRAPTTFIVPMAERLAPLMKTRLCTMLETDPPHIIIAFDEGAEPDEAVADSLIDRLAFHVTLDDVACADLTDIDPAGTLTPVTTPDAVTEEIVTLAVRLGITSLRAPTLALRAARAHAALQKRDTVAEPDVLAAAELVLAPRATVMPQPEPEAPPEEQPEPDAQDSQTDTLNIPDDLLLAAIATALPPDVLSAGSKSSRSSSGSGAGARKLGNRRGRPLPPRGTATSPNARVDLFATLRAAVPWQRLRQAHYPDRTGAIVLPQDLRHKRYLDLSDRLLVFAVDASGSSAISRLAEAKGAIELLLAEAYAKRDQVALIAFRGEDAELLLPPTRSLVQTKRRLADLPGGGATPLAAGMKLGLETSLHAQRKGLSPVLILLTDGRGNIALDGTPNRTQAAEDAQTMAGHVVQAGIETIVIDTSNRPEASLRALAGHLHGRYITLPRADARKLSAAVSSSLDS
jgi:magnesium chelatase subunit D